jgi:hypothetical protein
MSGGSRRSLSVVMQDQHTGPNAAISRGSHSHCAYSARVCVLVGSAVVLHDALPFAGIAGAASMRDLKSPVSLPLVVWAQCWSSRFTTQSLLAPCKSGAFINNARKHRPANIDGDVEPKTSLVGE